MKIGDKMSSSVSYKTELEDVITVEEVSSLFDSMINKCLPSLVSISIIPKLNEIKEKIIQRTTKQRDYELSQIHSSIVNRKKEIKTEIWNVLNSVNDKNKSSEQVNYESEQIINVYEQSIAMLENKERRLISGYYSKIKNVQHFCQKASIIIQIADLIEKINNISKKHDNCFKIYQEELNSLLSLTISYSTFEIKPIKKIKIAESLLAPNLAINDYQNIIYEEKKEYYLYEPNVNSIDDYLIYLLLNKDSNQKIRGTINTIEIIDNE